MISSRNVSAEGTDVNTGLIPIAEPGDVLKS
jgi:hypothetical protein